MFVFLGAPLLLSSSTRGRFSPQRLSGLSRVHSSQVSSILHPGINHPRHKHALIFFGAYQVGFSIPPGKSEIARDRLRQPSTNQIAAFTRATPAIYQSYLPDGRSHPAHIAHRTRTRTYRNAQHTAAHATIDVRSRHRTNPRSTRFVLGKGSENRRRPRSYHVDTLSRRR